MRKIFVTGIGTDVGKSVVSAVLTEALHADYWKPIQTGSAFGTDTEQIKKLVANEKSVFHPEAFCLSRYVSPYAAALEQNIEIDIASIKLPQTDNTLIIEGAGGLMVPITIKTFIIDLIQQFDAETILVVQNYLGSINHTLLSTELLKSRGIKTTGLIFNGPPNPVSEKVIVEYSGLPILGRINKEVQITKEIVSKYAPEFKHL